VSHTLEQVLAETTERAGSGVLQRTVQVLTLMLLDCHDDAMAALRKARAERSLGFMLVYAPALDPLARDARFRALMKSAGLMLPRWQPGSRKST
jgi:hypothetical protein